MTQRQIFQVFDQYQKARMQFVQTIADHASRPQNIELLQQAGVMALLRPLLLDNVPSIQQTAALALGRLANHSDDLAKSVVKGDILPQLVYSLAEQNRFYKKAAAFVVRAVAKHSAVMAQAVVDAGALEALVLCMEDFDPGVKEAAVWAIGMIARHNEDLGHSVVDAGAVPLLILCLQEPEMGVKRVAASALSEVSKHSPQLAQVLVDAGAIPHLVKFIKTTDIKLKRQILSALSQIGKHSEEMAELIVEADVFPAAFISLKDNDEHIKKNSATLIREIVKHSPELAQLIVNSGGIAALIDFICENEGHVRLPAIMALGYIAAHSEGLAMSVIVSKGIVALSLVLNAETEDYMLSATVWAVGQVGKHTPAHAQPIADANLLQKLLEIYIRNDGSEDLKTKAKKALKNILIKCTNLPALESLLYDAPPNILKHIISQFSKVLPNDPKARRLFVTSGGLKKMQEMNVQAGTELFQHVRDINNCFPEEIVKYYTPGYSETLLQRLDTFDP